MNIYIHARLHIWANSLQTSTGDRKLHGLLNFYVRACVCTLCACAYKHERMCAFSHFWMYSFQIWWRHSSAWATWFLHLRLHTMHAILARLYCMHVRVHTFLDWFFPNLVEHSTGHRDMHGLLDLYMHDCVCAISAYVHIETDSLQTWWKR
jgi:hypothetical protein